MDVNSLRALNIKWDPFFHLIIIAAELYHTGVLKLIHMKMIVIQVIAWVTEFEIN